MYRYYDVIKEANRIEALADELYVNSSIDKIDYIDLLNRSRRIRKQVRKKRIRTLLSGILQSLILMLFED